MNKLIQRRRATVALAMTLVVATLLAAGCGLLGGRKHEVIVASPNLPDNLVPILHQNDEAKMLSDLLYNSLAGFTGRRQSEIALELADAIEQNLEKKDSYKIRLKKDVAWHDGRPFDGLDVLYTWAAIQNPANDSPLRGRLGDIITELDTVGDVYTLHCAFRVAVAPDDALWLLSFKILPHMINGAEMPTNLVETDEGRAFGSNPVGTGSFRFVQRTSNELEISSINPDQAIQKVLFRLQRDPNLRTLNLIKNRVDVIFNVDPETYEQLDKKGLPHSTYAPKAFYALALNCSRGFTANETFRAALATGVNQVAIAAELFGEDGKDFSMLNAFPANDNPLYKRLPPTQAFDAEKAKTLVIKSGYNGEELELMVNEGMGSVGRVTGQRLVDQLKEIGVNAKLSVIGTAFQAKLVEGRYDMALVLEDGFGRKYDHYALYYSRGSRNISRIRNVQLDDVAEKWNNSIVMDIKFPLTQELNTILGRLNPYAYLFSSPQRVYYSKKLRNVTIIDEDALIKTLPLWNKG
ncbi:MAG: ABC transporter substrate-binding protein [bacterium]